MLRRLGCVDSGSGVVILILSVCLPTVSCPITPSLHPTHTHELTTCVWRPATAADRKKKINVGFFRQTFIVH